MTPDSIFLTIRPEHARAIYAGKKRAELRKSFPARGARLVFLYETRPVEAVTGAFIVRSGRRLPVAQIAETSFRYGVERERVEAYFGKRDAGWLVTIASSIKFAKRITLKELQRVNHRLHVPQVFAYLMSSEASSQLLQSRFVEEIGKQRLLKLVRLKKGSVPLFKELVKTEVSRNYEDIDDDFIEQLLDEHQTARAAFSTSRKEILEVRMRNEIAGFTVLSWKSYGAVKTGPTALLPAYRGLGLGQLVRKQIYRRASRGGARKVYCTCPSSSPSTLSYLLASGMHIEAVLEKHLKRDRDEYVLGLNIGKVGQRELFSWGVKRQDQKLAEVAEVLPNDPNCSRAMKFFTQHMSDWYFSPPKNFEKNILSGLQLTAADATISKKPKRLVVGVTDTGRIGLAVLVTPKRSDMLKLNIVANKDNQVGVVQLIKWILANSISVRRVYCTLPIAATGAICALATLGFKTEGILKEPFISGSDHMALGLVTSP